MQKLCFTPFPALSTGRLSLRQLADDDKNDILTLRSDEKNMKYLDRPLYKTVDEAEHYIEGINNGISEDKWVLWAICMKERNRLIGTVCLWNIDANEQKAEIGYELAADHQGMGIMQEALAAVLDFGFTGLKLKSIEAHTHPCNEKSVNLLKKFKFVRIRHQDVKAVYTLLRCLRCRA